MPGPSVTDETVSGALAPTSWRVTRLSRRDLDAASNEITASNMPFVAVPLSGVTALIVPKSEPIKPIGHSDCRAAYVTLECGLPTKTGIFASSVISRSDRDAITGPMDSLVILPVRHRVQIAPLSIDSST